VPRDIEAACGSLDGVTLRDIDDLQSLLARNLSSRAADVPAAEAIIAEEIDRFAAWLGQLDVRPTIAALHTHADEIVEQLLAENDARWESASPADLARVEAIARAVSARLLHEPTIRLKALDSTHSHRGVELLRELFDLPRDDELPRPDISPRHASQSVPADRASADGPRPLADNVRAIRGKRGA
jgi:glutamyl-tRNA reductase